MNDDGAAGNGDEFVEVVNVTDGDVNASGTVIEDGDGNTYTMPTGTVIPARQSAVVFRGGTPTGIPNIVDVGAPGLDNSGGTLRLKDAVVDVKRIRCPDAAMHRRLVRS